METDRIVLCYIILCHIFTHFYFCRIIIQTYFNNIRDSNRYCRLPDESSCQRSLLPSIFRTRDNGITHYPKPTPFHPFATSFCVESVSSRCGHYLFCIDAKFHREFVSEKTVCLSERLTFVSFSRTSRSSRLITDQQQGTKSGCRPTYEKYINQ